MLFKSIVIFMKKISLIIVILTLFLTSCGIYKYSPVKEEDYDVEKRVKKILKREKVLLLVNLKIKGELLTLLHQMNFGELQ